MPRHYRKSIPAVDWVMLSKEFPTHAEHIYRVRLQPEKLARLAQRLVGYRVKKLRSLRDGTSLPAFSKFVSLYLQKTGHTFS